MDNGYLEQAVERVVYALKHITDEHGQPMLRDAQPFLYPQPTAYPFAALYPGGAQTRFEDAGDPYHEQTYTVVIRIILGKAGEMFDGELQRALWRWQPHIINHFKRHPDLVFTSEQSHLIGLQPDGAQIAAITRLGQFRDDVIHVGMELSLELAFHIDIEPLWFADNEE